jgi:quinoprotein glucose dehydrogenase
VRSCSLALAALLAFIILAHAQDWPIYGGDPGGMRYSPAAQITKENVAQLAIAWTYHSGEAARRGDAFAKSAFELTPILADGKLLVCSPFDRVAALDPASGQELWVFDPELSPALKPANSFKCRGVALWRDPSVAPGAACAARVFLATVDARVFALDLADGKRCPGFGSDGVASFPPDIAPRYPGEYQFDSAPAVIGDVIVVGSAVDDMSRSRAPSGTVWGIDARSGARRWHFDPVPRSDDDPAAQSWANGSWKDSAGGSAWAPIAVDAERDLVFLPTAGPAASFYGGQRPGDNLYTSSVVALRGTSGAVVWHFQAVHHDIWDYDVAAQPSLVTLKRDGRDIAAVVVATKTGYLFVLDRDTGKPLFPVEERPVPKSDVPGEAAAPTQPVPLTPPPLVPQRLAEADMWGLADSDRDACRQRLAGLRSDGLFTPPSLKGTVLFPFTGGGANWGGGAFDAARQLFVINTNRIAHVIRLIPRDEAAAARAADPKVEIGSALGTPYAVSREALLSPLGLPCNAPPWGTLNAVDLGTGAIRWQVPLGALAFGGVRGLPGTGGPIITATGLVFIAASAPALRAFDIESGEELWAGVLPAGGQATPMTYVAGGRQFVVIAAGGDLRAHSPLGDAIVAFALPQ